MIYVSIRISLSLYIIYIYIYIYNVYVYIYIIIFISILYWYILLISIYRYIYVYIYISLSLYIYIYHTYIYYIYTAIKCINHHIFLLGDPPKWDRRRRAGASQLLHGWWLHREEVGVPVAAHGGPTVEIRWSLRWGFHRNFHGDFHGNHQRSHGGCNGISMGRGLVDWITPMSCHWLATGVIIRLYIIAYRKSFYKWENPWIGDEPDYEGY